MKNVNFVMGELVKRYFEYGALSAAILTLIYVVMTFFIQGYIGITSIFLCVAAGIITGVVIAMLLIYFAPGEAIPEGEEDSYINH